MKRFFSFWTLMLIVCANGMAQDSYPKLDTTKVYEVETVEVVTTYAKRTTPVAQDNLSRDAIERSSYGVDLPSALALTPSIVATNETAIGIGATSIRLRGTDATRIITFFFIIKFSPFKISYPPFFKSRGRIKLPGFIALWALRPVIYPIPGRGVRRIECRN